MTGNQQHLDQKRLYRNTLFAMDVLLLVGIPLALGILTNFVVAVIAFVMASVLIYMRKRLLDEKAEKLVLGTAPSLGDPGEKTASSPTDGRPITVMVLAAALVTAGPIISLAVHLGSGEAFPIWLIGCIAAIWFGVGMTAVGQWLGRR
jgi:hypothetical protein